MFPFVLGGAALLAIVFVRVIFSRAHATETRQRRVKLVRSWLLYGLAILILILAVTGRLHWLFASLSALLPWFARYLNARNLWQEYQQQRSRKEAERRSRAMTKEDAERILGVAPDASREEIIDAHRRLMARVHPDRGGSDDLAQRINEARRVLLGE